MIHGWLLGEKKEEELETVFSKFGCVKTLSNWCNSEQHISYLSVLRALEASKSFFSISEKVICACFNF